MHHMQAELKHSVPGLCLTKWVDRKPQNLEDYLDMSSQDGVWVAGRTPAIHHRHHHTPPAYTTSIHHQHTPPPLPTPIHRLLSQGTTGQSRWQPCSIYSPLKI
jgi:hypothetical protein